MTYRKITLSSPIPLTLNLILSESDFKLLFQKVVLPRLFRHEIEIYERLTHKQGWIIQNKRKYITVMFCECRLY